MGKQTAILVLTECISASDYEVSLRLTHYYSEILFIQDAGLASTQCQHEYSVSRFITPRRKKQHKRPVQAACLTYRLQQCAQVK